MKRIDPQAVAAWFRDHPDVRPIRHRYALFDGAGDALIGCCGLTSRVADDPEFSLASLCPPAATWSRSARQRLAARLALTLFYINGFVAGWDGVADYDVDDPGYSGCIDGRAAYEATTEALKS